MSLPLSILNATSRSSGPTYVNDVFSTYLYTGNGSTQTITNGIDLAGKGGLVWIKSRTNVATTNGNNHILTHDSNYFLSSDTTSGYGGLGGLVSPLSNGFSVGSTDTRLNNSSNTYVSWTFRKAPKFFDVVTYTGNGTSSRTISHALGSTPGMVIAKRTNTTSNWIVWHRSLTGWDYAMNLNLTNAASSGFTNINPTSSTFTIDSTLNTLNDTWVFYLFAHDTGTDGLIQCGSFTTDGSGNATVNLGWEPQFAIVKNATTATAPNWMIQDSMRGFTVGGSGTNTLLANTSGSEGAGPNVMGLTATGMTCTSGAVSATYIYLAILRPNKPPTTGTQVFHAVATLPTGVTQNTPIITGTGWPVDLSMRLLKNATGDGSSWVSAISDRLRGSGSNLYSNLASAEGSPASDWAFDYMDGVIKRSTGTNNYGTTQFAYSFRRAPGVFDVVCYTGTGGAITVNHSLGVVPELIIIKNRSGAENWGVWYSGIANNSNLKLNLTDGVIASGIVASPVTSTTFAPQTYASSSNTYVAYLFATKAGISKVGSYTGNGSSQTINCGFSAGARFVLIKRTDSTGDWYVWDSVRGIVAANDPHLSLNTTAAEVTTDDSIDPDTSGFIVNQVAATNVNVSSASYIYLAFA